MNVLADLNVLLDVFLNRTAWLAESAAVLAANQARRITVHLSAAGLPTIFYIVRRNAGVPQARGYTGSPVPVLSPTDLLARLSVATP